MLFGVGPEQKKANDLFLYKLCKFLVLEMGEVLYELNGKRFLLLVHNVLLLAQLRLVESQNPIQIQRTFDILLHELYDSLLFAEAAAQHLDHPDSQLGVDEGLDVELAQKLKVAQSIGGVHPGVFAELNQKLEVENVHEVALALRIGQLPQQRLNQKLNRNGGVFLEHYSEVGQNQLSGLFLLVVLNQQENQLFVHHRSDLVLGVSEEVQEVEEAEQGGHFNSVNVLSGVALELLYTFDQELLRILLIDLSSVVLP